MQVDDNLLVVPADRLCNHVLAHLALSVSVLHHLNLQQQQHNAQCPCNAWAVYPAAAVYKGAAEL
jgi:hypothetical protein